METKDKPVIVYRSIPEAKKEHVYSFTVTPEQAEFIKTHRKEINFSETFRMYFDSLIASYNEQHK